MRVESLFQWLPWSWSEHRTYVRSRQFLIQDGTESGVVPTPDWIDVEKYERVDFVERDALEAAWQRYTGYWSERQQREREYVEALLKATKEQE